LSSARRLFYQRGINNTGIDLVIADAAVAKASLYSAFTSKEALVAAYLESLRLDFEEALHLRSGTGSTTIDPLFDLLEVNLRGGEFHGCPFFNALVEMPTSEAVRREVLAYRQTVERFLLQASSGNHELTSRLVLIYDGVFVTCKINPAVKHVALARELAREVVEHSGDQRV
jgi:AcrR family transcriptional regulator